MTKTCIITVKDGCAEIYGLAPDGVDIIIVDQDGDYPYLCLQCGETWGPDSWDADATDVDPYVPTDEQLEIDSVVVPCPACRLNDATESVGGV